MSPGSRPAAVADAARPLEDAAQRRDRLGRAGEVAVGLLAGQLHELLAVRGDEERDPVRRREHRLDRRQARRRGREALAGPQGAELVDGRDASDGLVRGVGDPHLLEPQRQAGPEAHDDPPRQDLVQGGTGHGQHHGVAGVRIHGAQGQPERALRIVGEGAGDRGAVRDGVPLVVGVVDPDRVEAGVARPPRPIDDVGNVASGRKPQADATCQGAHVSPVSRRRASGRRVSAEPPGASIC